MAEKNLEDNTFDLTTWEEVRDMAQGRGGFAAPSGAAAWSASWP